MDSDLRELSPIERYEQRTAHFLEVVKRLEARSRGYSNLRLAIVVIAIVSVFFVPKDNAFGIILSTALLLFLLILFIAAVVRHQLIEASLQVSREMARRNAEGKARIARNWKDLPDRSPPPEFISSPLARDLDLFGRASLFDLLMYREQLGRKKRGCSSVTPWHRTTKSLGSTCCRSRTSSQAAVSAATSVCHFPATQIGGVRP
jgi:multisubunit Na+/H+ antiporter MnhG subunit